MSLPSDYESLSWEQMRHVVQKFLSFARRYTTFYLVAFMTGSVMGGASLVQGLQLKVLTEKVFQGRDMQSLNMVCLILIATVVVKGMFSYTQGYMMAVASNGTMQSIRDVVYRHLQSLPLPFHDRVRVGDLLARFVNDTSALTGVMTMGLTNLVNDIVIIIVSLSYMLYKSWQLTLLSMVTAPIIGLAMGRYGAKVQKFTARTQARLSELSSTLAETMASMKVVKCFTREDYEVERFAHTNDEMSQNAIKIAQMAATQNPVIDLLGTLGVVSVIWYSGRGIVEGRYTLGDMMAFWFFMVTLMNPVTRLGNTLSSLRGGIVSGVRVFDLLQIPSEADQHDGTVVLPELRGEVEFDKVTFAYNDSEPVLKDLSFTVKPGELVALVGPNGAGKTTIINLIPRFYRPQQGAVKVDGISLEDVKIFSMRSQCGIVPQENVLFSGSVIDNIRYGNLKATMDEIAEAARIANAHDFIEKLDKGYSTIIGERGVGLSGGQRQRVAIARAVLRNPRILILDEATSNLDQQAEQEVQEALERLMKGRTTFVIAHRLQTIRRADRILVVSHGRVVEQGRHEELMEMRGLYRLLYEAQREEWRKKDLPQTA
ncbi:MAG: ABC transporter ATP-binding protein [Candidatus Xenobia bacterium]